MNSKLWGQGHLFFQMILQSFSIGSLLFYGLVWSHSVILTIMFILKGTKCFNDVSKIRKCQSNMTHKDITSFIIILTSYWYYIVLACDLWILFWALSISSTSATYIKRTGKMTSWYEESDVKLPHSCGKDKVISLPWFSIGENPVILNITSYYFYTSIFQNKKTG